MSYCARHECNNCIECALEKQTDAIVAAIRQLAATVERHRSPDDDELDAIQSYYEGMLPRTPFIGQLRVSKLIAEIRRLRSRGFIARLLGR